MNWFLELGKAIIALFPSLAGLFSKAPAPTPPAPADVPMDVNEEAARKAAAERAKGGGS